MNGENRQVHYDNAVKGGAHRHRQSRRHGRRRRRVSRRARIYGAAFLLALTGFFCLVPGTSLSIIAFTGESSDKENFLRLIGPIFGGAGGLLLGISTGLVCYAMYIKCQKDSRNLHSHHAHEDGSDCYEGSDARDETVGAKVRLLNEDTGNTCVIAVKNTLVPEESGYKKGVCCESSGTLPPFSVVDNSQTSPD